MFIFLNSDSGVFGKHSNAPSRESNRLRKQFLRSSNAPPLGFGKLVGASPLK